MLLLQIEQMDSRRGAATFNILNAEDRPVAAALLKEEPGDAPQEYYDSQSSAQHDDMMAKARGNKQR
jgi:hypothetical protein